MSAKVQTLQHEFDSINSAERFDANIKKEHLHKWELMVMLEMSIRQ